MNPTKSEGKLGFRPTAPLGFRDTGGLVFRDDSAATTHTPRPSCRWDNLAARGPADVYTEFALMAIDELLLDQLLPLSDAYRELLYDATTIAAEVICTAAGVNASWDGDYEAAIAAVRERLARK